ncbi:MAG: D-alanyl-D-alanine carboxypeptidase [SAR324 cluster bacterium]|nr:D-alanyl-D-alanine carboxypeptidase [SAR324 cluster bacterium]
MLGKTINRLIYGLSIILGASLFTIWIAAATLAADNKFCQQIKNSITNGSLLVVDFDSSKILCSLKANQNFIPASLLKIPASLAILKGLGDYYQFRTNFWLDHKNNLIIEGLGDPFLTSEEIILISQELTGLNQISFNRLLLSHSKFGKITIPDIVNSTEPYDAINAALVVNFNSIYVTLSKDGKEVISAEKQTPLTEIAKNHALVHLLPGSTKRLNLGNNLSITLDYVGQLFMKIFSENKINFQHLEHRALTGDLVKEKQLLYVHHNPLALKEAIKLTLKYSNNMQINQMMLLLGAKKFGFPASLDKGMKALKISLKEINPDLASMLFMLEASGISRNNQASAKGMMISLDHFSPYYHLLNKKNDFYLKSGTLTGVYNYAGYLINKNNNDKSIKFVLMLNQPINNRDKLLALIKQLSKS